MSIHLLPNRSVLPQLRFLMRVAETIPALLKAVSDGHVEASQRLGTRKLADGREVELWLVVKAPRRLDGPLIRDRDSAD